MTLDQIDLADIYRTLNPAKIQYILFSSAGGIYSKIDYTISHKTILGKFKKGEIIPTMLLDHGKIKTEMKTKKIYQNYTITWKLISLSLNG